jgi:hypothetical protein
MKSYWLLKQMIHIVTIGLYRVNGGNIIPTSVHMDIRLHLLAREPLVQVSVAREKFDVLSLSPVELPLDL